MSRGRLLMVYKILAEPCETCGLGGEFKPLGLVIAKQWDTAFDVPRMRSAGATRYLIDDLSTRGTGHHV